MRHALLALLAFALAACGQQGPTDEVAAPRFEDGGCLGVLMAHRAAVNEGRAEGDPTTLTLAIEAYRQAGRATLSAEELAAYEASSFVAEGYADAEALGERAEICLEQTPQN
ncbi:MAG: hypothetical protein R3C16_03450 [Hyphomonadaceae bacterium]